MFGDAKQALRLAEINAQARAYRESRLLLARGGRWREARGTKPTIRSAVILISGFTLGHSATLIAASLAGLTLPGVLVETLIAVSVLIAALLGFNIGIELVQMAIALVIVPALLTIAATPVYRWLRSALALFCCGVAAVWVAESRCLRAALSR